MRILIALDIVVDKKKKESRESWTYIIYVTILLRNCNGTAAVSIRLFGQRNSHGV